MLLEPYADETDNNCLCKIATGKQKKTMELVHNSA